MIALAVGGFFHDFNAAAYNAQTGMIAAAEEERFSKRKHHPIVRAKKSSLHSIDFALSKIGADRSQVEYLILSDVQFCPLHAYLISIFPDAHIHFVEHHLCHAAAGYFCSGFNDAAIVALDGFGDLRSGLLAHGKGASIHQHEHISMQNSIGLEYLRVTNQIGLGLYGSEGKTQGLASYGEPKFYDDYLNEIQFHSNGKFDLSDSLSSLKGFIDEEHYSQQKVFYNSFLAERVPRRFCDEPILQVHMDAAASIQKVLDYAVENAAQAMKRATGSKNLVLTGGVAQNSTTNGAILKSGLYDQVYAHPSSSDRGNGLGALLYFVNHYLKESVSLKKPIVYGGGEYDQFEIDKAISAVGLESKILDAPMEETAALISKGNIVGWFQGRSELGARALGNRSILADPRKVENKDILNKKVKHREWFRPFAPAVLWEDAQNWFDTDRPLAYMQFTVPVREPRRDEIPAATHEDGSARVQTVSKEDNRKFYDLISAFKELTGVPVLINTSFNDSSDPIVETPQDALKCLLKTDLDYVVLADRLIKNPSH